MGSEGGHEKERNSGRSRDTRKDQRNLAALTIFAVVTRAREVGRAMPTDLLGPPGRRSGCWPHDGEVAGGAISF